MPTTYTASITFEANGRTAICHLPYAQTFPGVQTFAAALHQWSTANIIECSFTQAVDPQLNGSGEEIAEVTFRATVSLAQPGIPGTKQITIPAPDLDIFEHVSNGYRVKDDIGAAIAAAYSVLTGDTYTFVKGWMTS